MCVCVKNLQIIVLGSFLYLFILYKSLYIIRYIIVNIILLIFVFVCRFVKHMSHFLKLILFEVPFYVNAILLYTYILPIFPLDLATLAVSLENYYILLSNILLYFLNLLNCKILYYNKIFLDLFYDFFPLFHFVLVYVALYIYVLF